MLRTTKSLRGERLHATDGVMGRVREMLFSDDGWVVRYLVVDTGTWLPGRRVLLSPQALGTPDADEDLVPVALTMEQVEESPPLASEKPVSRQYERDLHGHFGWVPYWAGDAPPGDLGHPRPEPTEKVASRPTGKTRTTVVAAPDPHLRSSREVIGYGIEATDGSIGTVDDLVVETDDWSVRYLVVDTRAWLPGGAVILPPEWIESVDWSQRAVRVDLTREQVKAAPAFDPHAPINREYEARLYDSYGRPQTR